MYRVKFAFPFTNRTKKRGGRKEQWARKRFEKRVIAYWNHSETLYSPCIRGIHPVYFYLVNMYVRISCIYVYSYIYKRTRTHTRIKEKCRIILYEFNQGNTFIRILSGCSDKKIGIERLRIHHGNCTLGTAIRAIGTR